MVQAWHNDPASVEGSCDLYPGCLVQRLDSESTVAAHTAVDNTGHKDRAAVEEHRTCSDISSLSDIDHSHCQRARKKEKMVEEKHSVGR